MKVNDTNYRVNVLVLCQPPEVEVTIGAVECLLQDIETGVTISILVNGGESDIARDAFSGHPKIVFHQSRRQLGVAGGRNFLLSQRECAESDIVLISDNDVVLPVGYVRQMVTSLVETPDAGVIGPAVANFQSTAAQFIGFHNARGELGNPIFQLTSDDIRNTLRPSLTAAKLFHIGSHPDYRLAYLSAWPQMLRTISLAASKLLASDINFDPTNLAMRRRYLEILRHEQEPYAVSNVAGCGQVFWRKLACQIGGLDDRFNPYGFEDVDFCLRALEAGFQNYIDPRIWILHGTDTRHRERSWLTSLTTTQRGRTLLAAKRSKSRAAAARSMLQFVAAGTLVDFVMPRPDVIPRKLLARLRGLKLGLDAAKTPEEPVSFESTTVSASSARRKAVS